MTFQIFAPNNKKLNAIHSALKPKSTETDCLNNDSISQVLPTCIRYKNCRLNCASVVSTMHGNDRGDQFKSSFLYTRITYSED